MDTILWVVIRASLLVAVMCAACTQSPEGPPLGPDSCGPDADRPCADSRVVSGGMFFRSYDEAEDMAHIDMSRPATVSSFGLDTYEVTVGRFREFVAAGMGTQASPPAAGAGAHAIIANSGWDPAWNPLLAPDTTMLIAGVKCSEMYQTWTDTPGRNENRPMVCITWYEAMAFCAWDGGYLPTEAESMYAASGGNLQRAYPWSTPPSSTTVDCTFANFGGSNWPSTACVSAGAAIAGSTSPQGDGLWGQADLAGNVTEWVLDSYESPLPTPCNDCANLTPAEFRVIRGGSFNYDESYLRSAFRYLGSPANRNFGRGVRCARSP